MQTKGDMIVFTLPEGIPKFNMKALSLLKLVKNKPKKEKPTVFFTSKFVYTEGSTTFKDIQFLYPKRFVYEGPKFMHKFGTATEDESMDTVVGIQVALAICKEYPPSSEDDIAMLKFFTELYARIWECVKDVVPDEDNVTEDDDKDLLSIVANVAAAKKGGFPKPKQPGEKPEYCLKQLLVPTKKRTDDGKILDEIDPTKSSKLYVKFQCFGEGKKLKILTDVHDPQGNDINLLSGEWNKVNAKVNARIKLNDVFFGGHGNATCKASARLNVLEISLKKAKTMTENIRSNRMLVSTKVEKGTEQSVEIVKDVEKPEVDVTKTDFEEPQISAENIEKSDDVNEALGKKIEKKPRTVRVTRIPNKKSTS